MPRASSSSPDLAPSPRRSKRPRPPRWSSVGGENPRVRVWSPPDRQDLDSGDRGGDLDLGLRGDGLEVKHRAGALDRRHLLMGGVLIPVRWRRWYSFLCRGRSLLAPKLVDLAGGGRIQSGADRSMMRQHGEAGSSVMRWRGEAGSSVMRRRGEAHRLLPWILQLQPAQVRRAFAAGVASEQAAHVCREEDTGKEP